MSPLLFREREKNLNRMIKFMIREDFCGRVCGDLYYSLSDRPGRHWVKLPILFGSENTNDMIITLSSSSFFLLPSYFSLFHFPSFSLSSSTSWLNPLPRKPLHVFCYTGKLIFTRFDCFDVCNCYSDFAPCESLFYFGDIKNS